MLIFEYLCNHLISTKNIVFNHVLNSVKTGKVPLRLFLSRGASVGKSTVKNTLFEALIRYLNALPENIAVDQHNHDIFHKSTNEKI